MNELFKCFEEHCDGTVRPAMMKYTRDLRHGQQIVIQELSVEKCDKCGEVLFDAKTCNRIEFEIESKYPGYFKRK